MVKQDRARLGKSRAAALRDERGQVLVLAAVLMAGLLGVAAYAIDGGRFHRDNRRLQGAADAAALAGANNLPALTAGDPRYAKAITDAQSTGTTNLTQAVSANGDKMTGNGVTANVTKSSGSALYDTITVTVQDSRSAVLATVSGNGSAKAIARVFAVNSIDGGLLEPIIVDDTVADPTNPSWGTTVTLNVTNGFVPGNFAIVDDPSGTITSPTTMTSDPGAGKMHHVIDTLSSGQTILVPVYPLGPPAGYHGQGNNAYFDIIGFAAFRVDSASWHGNDGRITGHFVGWTTQAGGAPGQENFGLTTVNLIQ